MDRLRVSASYSNSAGDNVLVRNNFLTVGVAGDKTGLYGTSFAAPSVSGYAAVLGSKFTSATLTQIINLLLTTARQDTAKRASRARWRRRRVDEVRDATRERRSSPRDKAAHIRSGDLAGFSTRDLGDIHNFIQPESQLRALQHRVELGQLERGLRNDGRNNFDAAFSIVDPHDRDVRDSFMLRKDRLDLFRRNLNAAEIEEAVRSTGQNQASSRIDPAQITGAKPFFRLVRRHHFAGERETHRIRAHPDQSFPGV